MALRRISTPHDLGAAVRDARTAAQLTQAELAERAGVSREWLIGLERGARPRAELTKILGVLSTLDQPLMLGHKETAEAPEEDNKPAHDGAPMTTGEMTRRAIEQSRQVEFGTAANAVAAAAHTSAFKRALAEGRQPIAGAAALEQFARATADLPRPDFARDFLTQFADKIPKMDVSALLPKSDLAAMLPKADFSSLMPQPSPALVTLMRALNATQDAAHGDDDDEDGGRENSGSSDAHDDDHATVRDVGEGNEASESKAES